MIGKRYLGDGVYAEVDPRGLILTTENGISVTNTICFEHEVIAALIRYIEDMIGAPISSF